MVLHWILVVSVSLAANGAPVVKKLSFDGCSKDDWSVTDISLEPNGTRIHVVADVGYDERVPNKLHQIRVTLTGCGADFKCTGYTTPVINDIDCLANHGTDLDREACEVATALAEWELDSGAIFKKSKNKTTITAEASEVICVHYDTKQIDVNAAIGRVLSEHIEYSNK